VKRWVGLGWDGIHQEFVLFVCWGIFGGGAVFLLGFVFLFHDDYAFWLWCRHEQWFFAMNVVILILQCNTYHTSRYILFAACHENSVS
jgi:hypothetical protein